MVIQADQSDILLLSVFRAKLPQPNCSFCGHGQRGKETLSGRCEPNQRGGRLSVGLKRCFIWRQVIECALIANTFLRLHDSAVLIAA